MNERDLNSIPTQTAAPLSLSAVTPTNPETIGEPVSAGHSTPPCIGEYVILGELGRGGMGVVFRAEDSRLKREVALKVMLPQFAANPQAKLRFVREARAQAKVEHDHVVHILHIADHDGLPYIVMPLLKGLTLQAALKANPRPPLTEVIRIGREVAEGLAAAHEKGLVHRDIKPANIWLEGKKLRVKLLDFGLARVTDADTDATDGPVTREGAVVGTPAYMSPEQGRGLAVDGRTDLWSLGVILYQMTTGELPFRGATQLAILTSLALDNPPHPLAKNPSVPPHLSDFVMRLLAKDPAYRPPTAEAAVEELRVIEAGMVNAVRVVPLDSPPPLILAQIGPDPFADLDATEASMQPEVTEREPDSGRAESVSDRSSQYGFPVWALVGVVLLAVAGIVGAVVSQLGKKPPEVVQGDTPTPMPTGPQPDPPKDKPIPAARGSAAEVLTSTDWEWTEPANLSEPVNSEKDDLDPSISGDGLRFTFRSNRDGTMRFYEARRKSIADIFGDVRRLDELGDAQDSPLPFLSADALNVRFVNAKSGQPRVVLHSHRPDRDSKWQGPLWVTGKYDPATASAPATTPDALKLYFVRQRNGSADIWVAQRPNPNSNWGEGEPLEAEVNTGAEEGCPRPLPDGSGLTFTRKNGNGPVEWMLATPKPGGWDVRTILSPAWPDPSFSEVGRTVVFHSQNLPNARARDICLIRRVPKATPNAPTFFNGKDLTGWKCDPRVWTVANGEVVASRPAGDNIWQRLGFPRPLGDFELSFDARVPSPADKVTTTLYFRASDSANCGILNLSGPVTLWLNKATKCSTPVAIDAQLVEKLFVRDAHNRYLVRVVGNTVTVLLNGTRVNEAIFPDLPERGQLMWTLQPGATELRLRNLRVELPPPDPTFFNGRDMTGWADDPFAESSPQAEWKVIEGELVGTAAKPEGYKSLQFHRPVRDFELSFRCRGKPFVPGDKAQATIRFRKVGSGKSEAGLELSPTPFNVFRIDKSVYSTLLPPSDAARKAGKLDDYNDVVLRVVGRRATVRVNGVLSADGECNLPDGSMLLWSIHPGCAEFRVRDITFRDLGNPVER